MRYIIFLLLLGLLPLSAQSQRFKRQFEMGFMGGGSYYIGDLNPTKHFIYSKPAFGGIVRYNMSRRWSFRFTGTYGSVFAQDSKSDDPFQLNRNLSFSSRILELAFGVEIDLFKYAINDMENPISPYFFYEVAVFIMNPQADYLGDPLDLQPLGTEGQGSSLSTKNNYRLTQLSIPLGIGVKFNLAPRLAMSIEYGVRKTFTDYLDDVSGNYVDSDLLRALNGPLAAEFADPALSGVGTSQSGFNRGNPATKDWYMIFGAMLTFKPFKSDICDMRGWR